MTGLEFEKHCAKILKKSGYHNVQVTKSSGDYGVDVLASKRGHKYAIQCKYYKDTVGNSAVQEVVAGMRYYDCDRSIVMTNSTFTKSAKQLAAANNVELWENVKGSPKQDLKKDILICLLLGIAYEFWLFLKGHPIALGISIGLLIAGIVFVIVYKILTRKVGQEESVETEAGDELPLEELRTIWSEIMGDEIKEQLTVIDEYACDAVMLVSYYGELSVSKLQQMLNVEQKRAKRLIRILKKLKLIERKENEPDLWKLRETEDILGNLDADEQERETLSEDGMMIDDKIKQVLMEEDMLYEAVECVVSERQATIPMLQTRLRIGYNRAATLLEMMEERGIVGPQEGSCPRQVLLTEDELECLDIEISDEYLQKKYVVDDDDRGNAIREGKHSKKTMAEDDIVPYSPKAYEELSKLSNMLVEKSSDEVFDLTIRMLNQNYSLSDLQIMLIDSTGLYNNMDHLLIPVLNDANKIETAFGWACAEMNARYKTLSEIQCTDFRSYNDSVKEDERLPNIFIIVSELYSFPEIEGELKSNLMELLMKGKRVGVFSLFFTRLNSKNFKLKEIGALLKVIDSSDYKQSLKKKGKSYKGKHEKLHSPN